MSNPPNEPPHFVTCPCQYCSGHIEFDASGFAKGETRTVECPHCKLETLIFVPQQKAPPIITPSNQQGETPQPFASLSYNDSIELIRNAAEHGDARAQHWLAFRYINGEGVPEDYSKAAMWLNKAAERGFVESQIHLGFAYLEGMGLPRDYSKAVIWLSKAVEQGNAVAQNMLGCCYMEGEAIPKDYHKAALLFIKAAEQGNPDAQFNLAGCCLNGWGVPQDSVDAYRYANLAAAQGNKAAIEMRDELSKKLSLSQITEGQRRTDPPKQTPPPPPKPLPHVLPKNITPPPLAPTNPKSFLEVVSILSLIGFFVWTALWGAVACWVIFATFSGISEDGSAAFGAGATIGLGIWLVVCLVIWLFGAAPAAMIWFMTRKR